jgi:hypothetical protein
MGRMKAVPPRNNRHIPELLKRGRACVTASELARLCLEQEG